MVDIISRSALTFLLVLASSCICTTASANAADGKTARQPCELPRTLDDGWKVSTANETGFDPVLLCAALNKFAASETNFHSLIVERRGQLVAEVYKRGKDESLYSLVAMTTNFDEHTQHDVRSISKSVVSLLWGIAEAQGKTPPLTTPVLDLLPALAHLKNAGREKITLAHLMTMSSGLDWSEPNTYKKINDEFGLYWRTQDNYLFDRPMAFQAGTRFNYNGGGTAVLAQILVTRTGKPLPEYAREFLFAPLGITDWEWKNDLRGRPLSFAGLRLKPRDISRIGRMLLNNGQWQGKQIVPAAWVSESMRSHIDTGEVLGYGYQWWTGSIEALRTKRRWTAGFGNGGQRLYMLPSLDMTVVITAGDYGQPSIGRAGYQLFTEVVAAVRE